MMQAQKIKPRSEIYVTTGLKKKKIRLIPIENRPSKLNLNQLEARGARW
jgi:hypothetical protein